MKLKELVKIPIAIVKEPTLNFISPNGYIYKKEQILEQKDRFLESKILEFHVRRNQINICISLPKEEK